jgi:hypothetical protein
VGEPRAADLTGDAETHTVRMLTEQPQRGLPREVIACVASQPPAAPVPEQCTHTVTCRSGLVLSVCCVWSRSNVCPRECPLSHRYRRLSDNQRASYPRLVLSLTLRHLPNRFAASCYISCALYYTALFPSLNPHFLHIDLTLLRPRSARLVPAGAMFLTACPERHGPIP